jgi:hypothetical protein
VKSPRKSEASALSKLEALDLSILTEEQRHSAIAEVRAQIAEVAADRRAESPVMERKLALLRLWQRLVQLRIADVRDEVPPPDVRPVVERMFAPEPKPEPAPAAPVEEAAAPAPAPQPKRKGGAQVTVKLIEEAVIKGKTYAADEVVQVSRKEADGLVEAGKATVVDAAQPPEAPA